MIFLIKILMLCLGLLYSAMVSSHHVLGRPSYSLSEDSNTPPSMAVETQIGDFFVTYMVFPAFPKPNQPGRINLYIQAIDENTIFNGEVRFTVIDNGWFSQQAEQLGQQMIDDGVYRQGFEFLTEGKYVIRAHFDVGSTPYDIDFPLQVGDPSPLTPLAIGSIIILVVLIGSNILLGRRSRIATLQLEQKESPS